MFAKTFFGVVFIAMAVFTAGTSASASDKYDPYNHCGAPFCGSTGGAAAAGVVARMQRHDPAGTPKDKPVEKPVKDPSKV